MKILFPIEVDSILRMDFGTAEKMARAGALPHIVLPDGNIRFREDDVARILQSQGEAMQGKPIGVVSRGRFVMCLRGDRGRGRV